MSPHFHFSNLLLGKTKREGRGENGWRDARGEEEKGGRTSAVPQRARHRASVTLMECDGEREGQCFGERSLRIGKQHWERREKRQSEIEGEDDPILRPGGHRQLS